MRLCDPQRRHPGREGSERDTQAQAVAYSGGMSEPKATARPKRGTGAFLVLSAIGGGVGSMLFWSGLSQNLIDGGSRYGGDGGGAGLMVLGVIVTLLGVLFGAIAVKNIGDTIDVVHEAATLRLVAQDGTSEVMGTNGTSTSIS